MAPARTRWRTRAASRRTWAEGILRLHAEEDGGCRHCRWLHGTAVAWPCRPVRVAEVLLGQDDAPG